MPRKSRENTLAGFALAVSAGAQGIELDVHATADGIVIVHHDPVLPAPPGAPHGATGPAIRSLTFAQLRHETFHGGEIPSLEEALACIDGRAVVYVEIKAPDIERAVVDELLAHEAPAAIHSFDHRIAQRVRHLAPQLATGILSSSYLLEPEGALRAAQARDFWQSWELIDGPLVERIHAAGGRVIAWTVNGLDAVERLRALGVDGLCTDVADVVHAFLRTHTS
jgi:glycerophosphoryl diester phosphodiesterase